MVRRPDPVRADIAENVERDVVDPAQRGAHLGEDRKLLLIAQRRIAPAGLDAVELAHQHEAEADHCARVVGEENAGDGDIDVAQQFVDIDLLRHLPMQLCG
ncbi:hypothetical protein ACVWY2_001192 [Bradyrhizobium sp. JR6.1]